MSILRYSIYMFVLFFAGITGCSSTSMSARPDSSGNKYYFDESGKLLGASVIVQNKEIIVSENTLRNQWDQLDSVKYQDLLNRFINSDERSANQYFIRTMAICLKREGRQGCTEFNEAAKVFCDATSGRSYPKDEGVCLFEVALLYAKEISYNYAAKETLREKAKRVLVYLSNNMADNAEKSYKMLISYVAKLGIYSYSAALIKGYNDSYSSQLDIRYRSIMKGILSYMAENNVVVSIFVLSVDQEMDDLVALHRIFVSSRNDVPMLISDNIGEMLIMQSSIQGMDVRNCLDVIKELMKNSISQKWMNSGSLETKCKQLLSWINENKYPLPQILKEIELLESEQVHSGN